MLVTDQATADYAHEQENRARLEDAWAEWTEAEQPRYPPKLPPSKVCTQCINWQPERHLHLADGTRQTAPGFCTARAAAGLQQMSPDYAEHCRFYEEYIPF